MPETYDVFEYVIESCLYFETMGSFLHTGGDNLEEKREELAFFVNEADADLMRLVSNTNIKGNKGRRLFIEQFLHIMSVMTGPIFLRVGAASGEVLFDRLDEVLTGEARSLIRHFGELCGMILNCVKPTEILLNYRVRKIPDACGPWEWKDWQQTMDTMMNFSVSYPVCEGPLQIVVNDSHRTCSHVVSFTFSGPFQLNQVIRNAIKNPMFKNLLSEKKSQSLNLLPALTTLENPAEVRASTIATQNRPSSLSLCHVHHISERNPS